MFLSTDVKVLVGITQLLALQSALEESQLSKKQLEHKLEVQTETLNNKMEELRALNENTQSSMTSEMMEVQLKIMELETLKVSRASMVESVCVYSLFTEMVYTFL